MGLPYPQHRELALNLRLISNFEDFKYNLFKKPSKRLTKHYIFNLTFTLHFLFSAKNLGQTKFLILHKLTAPIIILLCYSAASVLVDAAAI